MNKLRFLILVGLLGLIVVSAAAARHIVVIRGTHGDDALTGTPSRDLILAKAGNDAVSGLGGNDRIFAGWGDDVADGGIGNDRIIGGPGNDVLNGSDGNDRIRGRHGNDNVDGGNGADRLFVGRGVDIENGGEGNDVLHALARDNQVDTLDCGPGQDVVWLNANEQDTHVNCEVVRTVTTTQQDD
jgi:Ca2+-binding RTX toxin-like protein